MENEQAKYGSPTFYKLLQECAALHSKKSHDYANQADPYGNYHFAGQLSKLFDNPDDAGFVGRLAEKLFRLANLENGNKNPLNESVEDTERDIVVITGLWVADRRDRRKLSYVTGKYGCAHCKGAFDGPPVTYNYLGNTYHFCCDGHLFGWIAEKDNLAPQASPSKVYECKQCHKNFDWEPILFRSMMKDEDVVVWHLCSEECSKNLDRQLIEESKRAYENSPRNSHVINNKDLHRFRDSLGAYYFDVAAANVLINLIMERIR